ncbi:phage tail terminator-like protein [Stutzerimonas nitrititolerans]|uniref:phage tail terminator-like protein n=1 Tax=Stutzerimonas nitrititolerans TaxID=2482751 RepID=UPI0028A99D55|nr:phage tail terminator-like protein [Stutzerimonas nitrititolerans]
MSETNINAALVSAYLASGVMPQERTAFEGVKFDPVTGQSWARLTGLPSGRGPAAMGADAPQEWTGILQVDLFHPKGTGTGPILADADKALEFFTSGKRLDYQGQGVLIRRAERSQIRQEDVWQSVSISVYCTSWTFPA